MKREARESRAPTTVDDTDRQAAHVQDQLAALTQILEAIDAPDGARSLEKILQIVVDSAAKLCHADSGSIIAVENGQLQELAFTQTQFSDEAAYRAARKANLVPIDRTTVTGRVLLEGRSVLIADIFADPGYVRRPMPGLAAKDDPSGIGRDDRSVLGVPLRRQDEILGVLVLRRVEVAPFSDEDLATVETFARPAAVAIQNARLLNATKEALEQQTATSDVLRIISRSAFDLGTVLQTLVERAVELGGAENGSIARLDGEELRIVASAPAPYQPKLAEGMGQAGSEIRIAVDRGSLSGRAVLDRKTVHVADLRADAEYTIEVTYSTGLAVPLLRDDEVLGVFMLRRASVAPFAERQIQLVETFADQAAIAIENVRLFNETKEALERQTAIAEILKVISSSPTDLQPVLDAIAGSARQFCGAEDAVVAIDDGDVVSVRAHVGPLAAPQGLFALDRTTVTTRSMVDRTTIHVADLQRPEYAVEYPIGHEQAKLAGQRATLATPLLREGKAIGAIMLRRSEPRPFSERQVELAQTFADQAVIAIENVRLFNETKEALDQQSATRAVLEAISAAALDLDLIFRTIVENSVQLCSASGASLLVKDGDVYQAVAHAHPVAHSQAVAHAQAEELQWFADLTKRRQPVHPGRASLTGRVLIEGRTVQIPDVREDPEYEFSAPTGRDRDHIRALNTTLLGVPVKKGDEILGVIVARRAERPARPFNEREIGILETFADQAAIAIENVRLFNETKEALEQQTATAEVLRVISSSPTDVQPVLDAVAASARRFCAAEDVTVVIVEGAAMTVRAHDGPLSFPSGVVPADPTTVTGRSISEARTVHVVDLADAEQDFPLGARFARDHGEGTNMATPLLREGKAIGAILLRRLETKPFTDKQADLLRTFADQAVIAIENVRLFNETNEALERQTATSEVLRSISGSAFEIGPVFEAILDQSLRLCDAEDAMVVRAEDGGIRVAAHRGPVDIDAARLYPMTRGLIAARAVIDGATVHVPDMLAEPTEFPESYELATAYGFRSTLATPLRRQGAPVGAILIRRRDIRPFSPEQVRLLETFADQAVIAIENVRLFNETKEALDQQAATARVLQVISRSAFDLRSALETLVEEASRLCAADHGSIHRWDGTAYRTAAFWGPTLSEEYKREGFEAPRYPGRDTLVGRTALEREVIHILDATTDPEYSAQSLQKLGGYRTMLGVPLMRDGFPIGVFALLRGDVRPFTDRQIELVRTFADQAAIAIENVRLFTEIQDKSQQLEVASRHKSEFLANMSHELRTPLNAIIGFTDVMLEEMFGPLNDKQKEYLEDVRNSGTHLLTLINDILDLSKVEAGRVELEMGEFSFPDALENALTLVRERATRQGISLAADVAGDVGRIIADERKVKQVLVNLLANAVKFTPDGGRVTVKARRLNGEIEIAVHDTGIGVATEDQDRIFDEFQQVGRDPERSREGTGLGLTLAKRFVELHGGRIWVESEVGKGSTFTFAIPLRQTALADAKG